MSQESVQKARRAKADLVDRARAQIAETNKVEQRAKWEVDTHAQIRRRAARNEAEGRERSHQQELYARKQELARLYNSEMQSWQNEVNNAVETAEDRKTSLRRRAEALRAEREAMDREFVAEKRQQQWR